MLLSTKYDEWSKLTYMLDLRGMIGYLPVLLVGTLIFVCESMSTNILRAQVNSRLTLSS